MTPNHYSHRVLGSCEPKWLDPYGCWCQLHLPTVFEAAGDRINAIDRNIAALQQKIDQLSAERAEYVKLRRNGKSKTMLERDRLKTASQN